MKQILITNVKQLLDIINDESKLLYHSIDGFTPFNVSKILYYNKSMREICEMISNRELYFV